MIDLDEARLVPYHRLSPHSIKPRWMMVIGYTRRFGREPIAVSRIFYRQGCQQINTDPGGQKKVVASCTTENVYSYNDLMLCALYTAL